MTTYTATGTGSPITVPGLPNANYTFTVAAQNAVGTGPASAPTGLVTVGGFVRPSGAGYQRYEDLYVTGDTITATLNRATTGNIVTFPVGTFTCRDFLQAGPAGIAVPTKCAGIWGSGPGNLAGTAPGTYFTMAANSSTQAPVTASGTTTPYHLMRAGNSTVPQSFGQFQVQGTEQGHTYHGFSVWTPSSPASLLVQDLLVTGWSGSANYPPGECFGVEIGHASGHRMIRVEADGRRADGTKFGSSPLTAEFCNGFTWTDCKAHHSIAGMCTFYKSANGNTYNLYAGYTGSGSGKLNGSCINHELTAGIVHHTPTLFLDRTTGNTSLHISHSNDAYSDATIGDVTHGSLTLLNPTWNDAFGDGNIHYQSFGTENGGPETNLVPPVGLDANGNVIPYVWAH